MSSLSEHYRPSLLSGIQALGLTLTNQQVDLLLAYLELLCKWNKAYNLTAVRNPDEMLSRHLLDSLSVVPYITADKVLDVGTGPGLPGIPLAICYPEKQFTLLDSNGKKTRFLTQCKLELGLPNITIVHGRAEQHQPTEGYHQIVSRAFSALSNIIEWCEHLLTQEGHFVAMKGIFPEEEIAAMPEPFSVIESHQLDVPGCDGQRHLVIVGRR